MTVTKPLVPDAVADKTLMGMTPGETARYTRELLESLRGIAVQQEQFVLASLLEAASREAKKLASASY